MFVQAVIIVITYALGCISFGYYLVRWRSGQDLREIGSGATGGRNAGRVLGRWAAIAVGIADGLKGVLAIELSLWFKLEPWAIALSMVAVLAGHVWPLQLGFRGGKGLSTAFGAVLTYDYRIALLTAVVALLVLVISRNRFFFLMGVASSPIIAFALGQRWEIVTGLVGLILVILFAHRANIREALKQTRP